MAESICNGLIFIGGLTINRIILPDWAKEEFPDLIAARDGEFSDEEIEIYNKTGYNVYWLPNCPSQYDPGTTVSGSHIDSFRYVFADMDLKQGSYADKQTFIDLVLASGIDPSFIIDSGNGVHVYWKVTDLDAMSFLRLQRRICRRFDTDDAVSKIYQLMRVPGTLNMKVKESPKPCVQLYESEKTYTCEELDRLFPPITHLDEDYCKQHFEKTYRLNSGNVKIDDKIPLKFAQLLRKSQEVKDIWAGSIDDRSKADYRLGHIMFASGFTKEEALSVLVNSAKALERAPVHRLSYAAGIVDKIWTHELENQTGLSQSVEHILSQNDDESLKGTRFPCYRFFDGTKHGFRLGQVIGLCAGVGVGKTAIALNFFKGFVELNPNYIHMFVALEQPGREIADRWKKMCGDDTKLHKKVHILSNYNEDGSYRNLSLNEVQDYILDFQKKTGLKVGCICLDHIGVLKKETRNGENQGLMDVCSELKSFAIATETLFVVQSQTNREKAGIGDLELFKDCAYGTQHFESFVDFLLAAWQPLKRAYGNPDCPRVTAYKFAKIRFKSKTDVIIEDECYRLLFDGDTETLREMNQYEEKAFDFFASQALNARKRDRKTDLVPYKSIKWSDEDGKPSDNQDTQGT